MSNDPNSPFLDFDNALDHLSNPSEFPSNYLTRVLENTTKKYYAISPSYVAAISCQALKYKSLIPYREGNTFANDLITQEGPLPSTLILQELTDACGNLKSEFQENIDFILISKKNQKMIKTIIDFFEEDGEFPKLPKVFVRNEDGKFIKDTTPIMVTFKLTLKSLNNADNEVLRNCEVYRTQTVERVLSRLKVLYASELIFTSYDIQIISSDSTTASLSDTIGKLLDTTETPNTISIIIKELKLHNQWLSNNNYSYSNYNNSSSMYGYNYGSRYYDGYDNDEMKRGTKGVCGLQNLGNTCFMNSSIQCIVHVMPLVKYFERGMWKNEVNTTNPLGTQGKLASAWADLVNKYWGGHSYISPKSFKTAIGEFAPQFSGYQQHDSQELMSFLIDGIHEDLNRVVKKVYVQSPDYNGETESEWAKKEWERYKIRNDSIITDLFTGQFKSKVVCDVCGKVNLKFDSYIFWSLTIPNKTKLVKFTVFDKSYQHVEKVSIDVENKSRNEIVEECLKNTNIFGDCEDFVVVKYSCGEKVERLVEIKDKIETQYEYAVVQIQDKIKEERKTDESEHPKQNNNEEKVVEVEDIQETMNEIGKEEEANQQVVPHIVIYDMLFKYTDYSTYRVPFAFHSDDSLDGIDARMYLLFKEEFSTYSYYYNTSEQKEEKQKEEAETEKHFIYNDQSSDVIEGETKEVSKFRYFSVRSSYSRDEGDPVSLEECIEAFQEEEKLDGDNKAYCSGCKQHQPAHKKMDLWCANKVLVIHLKRFGNASGSFRDKVNTLVNFPIEGLDLTKYIKADQKERKIYDLVAVSNHSGSLAGGHYVASAKVGNEWYDFNDSSTSRIEGTERDIVSSGAYVLFYIRRDDEEYSSSLRSDASDNAEEEEETGEKLENISKDSDVESDRKESDKSSFFSRE
ncbi:hypothetical protein EIN_174040 [Entamoeba invadens IP1]|uniref:Ubiquitin carboxyl-terminal hydrolase n=1 Tax=Entamoeba invadens IP1 TaxID=370355 RepID=A0A0A1TW26_ENTIV|nr:hypothetical protein EIN_174040 [Entamoeba invadens IP1]ELP84729.1 hypothetical protein EIN_174040 [Entamoeba invadens IP1]|eukprot:XP_004184075.1 hypothetical protein EIN_174040 [Entamoeba invadens IP1]